MSTVSALYLGLASRRSAAWVVLALCGCASTPTAPTPAAPATLELQVLAFNDFHGNLEPPSEGLAVAGRRVEAGGVEHLAGQVAWYRARAPHTLVVAAGDLIGASPLASSLFHDEPTVRAMNVMGLDVLAVGNHEFDDGADELVRLMKGGCHPKRGCRPGERWTGARFDVLAANVRRTGAAETLFPASVVKRYDGVAVGVVGLTLEGTAKLQPASFGGVEFADEVRTVNAEVERLRAQGVRAIVVVVHEGGTVKGFDVDGCQDLEGPIVKIVEGLHAEVDLVVSGHTHRFYNCVVAGRRTTSAGSYGRGLTRAVLTIDRASGDVVRVSAENKVVTHTVAPDAAVSATVAPYLAEARVIGDRVVGRIAAKLVRDPWPAGGSPLGAVLADAHLAATRALGAEVAFMHPGGIRTELRFEPTPPEAAPGEVRLAEVGAVQPFENLLEVYAIRADALATVLAQHARRGGEGALSPSASFRYALGERGVDVRSLRLDGKPVRADREVKVAVNAYLAGKGFSAKGRRLGEAVTDTDALRAYFEAQTAPVAVPAPRVDAE